MFNSMFVEVILPLALPKLYTFSVPNEMEQSVQRGARVLVQFGSKRLYAAIVYSVHGNAPKGYVTKDILQVIDSEPLITEHQLKLWDWMSEYYMCMLGEIMQAGLPAGLKMGSETVVTLSDQFDGSINFSPKEKEVLQLLEGAKNISIEKLISQVTHPNPMGTVQRLLDNRSLSVYENLVLAYKPKYEAFVKLHPRVQTNDELNAVFEGLSAAPAQMKYLMAFVAIASQRHELFSGEIAKSELTQKAGASSSAFNALVEKEVFTVEQKEVSRFTFDDNLAPRVLSLTKDQEVAKKGIEDIFEEKSVALLHGVTSSGKTEIYISLIQEQLRQGKQVLYLLPEIALTTQIINRLKGFFGDRVGIYHSKFSDNQRVEVYRNLLQDGASSDQSTYDIILGVRSSIFLPFKRLGLIIVDEEHENTFKQYNPAPRYHARDSAIVMAGFHGAKVLLGTATPSVESFYNAQIGKYGLVTLDKRYMDIALPRVEVVDMLAARKRKQTKSIFSDKLLEAIDTTLKDGHQAILFQNRRGYSPFIECDECAWVPQCEFCAVSLTLHKQSNQLVCHYCGYSTPILNSCMACGSHRLSAKGFGTEKVEDELAIFFPHATIARLDTDSARSRKSYETIIARFEQREIDILVGTQMVAKGLDFDGVRLVGILNADNMLNFPDFRAHERSFQLLTQVSGRAGRKEEQGWVLIQTANPDHDVIGRVLQNDVNGLLKSQLRERKEYHYPPYFRLVRLSLKHRDAEVLGVAAEQLARNLRVIFKKRVLGPEEPMIGRVQGYYLKDLLLKFERNTNLPKAKELIDAQIALLMEYKPYRGLVVQPDVDPM